MNLKNIKIKANKFLFKHKEIKNFIDWLRFVLEYGIATNIVFTGIFNFRFDILTVLGFGILWFFIKYEIPRIKSKWSE